MPVTPTERAAVSAAIQAGIVPAWGEPAVGRACLAGAILLGLREPWEMRPSVVADADFVFWSRLADGYVGTALGRALVFHDLAMASLNTDGTDRSVWSRALVVATIRDVLPLVLRDAGTRKGRLDFATAAAVCEVTPTRASATAARDLAAGEVDDAWSAAYTAVKGAMQSENGGNGNGTRADKRYAAVKACAKVALYARAEIRNQAIGLAVGAALEAYGV